VAIVAPGLVVWLTGLPCSGKSTLATLVAAEFARSGVPYELLDGDATRARFSKKLGFSREDRDAHVERLAFVAELLSRHGVAVIVAAISPYRDTRDRVRACLERYVEVYVDCPLATCEQRDIKGMYAQARAGLRTQFTGIHDPYEIPQSPDIHLRTDRETPEESSSRLLAALAARGLVR
jgi:adenylylsulfate kinase